MKAKNIKIKGCEPDGSEQVSRIRRDRRFGIGDFKEREDGLQGR